MITVYICKFLCPLGKVNEYRELLKELKPLSVVIREAHIRLGSNSVKQN